MPPSSINHGLSVFTHADAAAAAATTANRRLRWPLADDRIFPISNCCHDATSGAFYPGHRSGPEGIDFACGVGTPVHALYGGVVVKIQDRDSAPYGQFVTLHSGTDRAANSGFRHTYAHWAAGAGAGVQLAAPVSKGPLLGGSGTRGGVEAHLQVQLQPFGGPGGVQPAENIPPHGAIGDQIEITPAATRISGCMNFACFLPASHGGPPVTFDFLRSFNQLLRARDASARIPVYREMWSDGRRLPDTALQAVSPRLGTIDGSPLGGYVVTGLHPGGPSPAGYQIRWTEPENGWVFQSGTGGAHHGPWVQVEEAPARRPGPPRRLTLGMATRGRDAQPLRTPCRSAGCPRSSWPPCRPQGRSPGGTPARRRRICTPWGAG